MTAAECSARAMNGNECGNSADDPIYFSHYNSECYCCSGDSSSYAVDWTFYEVDIKSFKYLTLCIVDDSLPWVETASASACSV